MTELFLVSHCLVNKKVERINSAIYIFFLFPSLLGVLSRFSSFMFYFPTFSLVTPCGCSLVASRLLSVKKLTWEILLCSQLLIFLYQTAPHQETLGEQLLGTWEKEGVKCIPFELIRVPPIAFHDASAKSSLFYVYSKANLCLRGA